MGLCNELWQSGDIPIFLAISLRVWFSVFLMLGGGGGGERKGREGGRRERTPFLCFLSFGICVNSFIFIE